MERLKDNSERAMEEEMGAQGDKVRGQDYPLTGPYVSAFSSYRQEREGFLPSHPPAPGRKPIEFMDVSDLPGSVPAAPCPTHLFPYCSLFPGLPCLAISCPSHSLSPAAPSLAVLPLVAAPPSPVPLLF